MSAPNKQKKQDITKLAAVARVLPPTQVAAANDGGFDNFQTTVSRKQRIEYQKKTTAPAAEETKQEELPLQSAPAQVIPV